MPEWEFLHKFGKYNKENPAGRRGQNLFNFAHELFGGKFTESLDWEYSGPLDPYYHDSNIPRFMEHLRKTECLTD